MTFYDCDMAVIMTITKTSLSLKYNYDISYSLIIEGTVMRAKSYSAESTSSSEDAESDMSHLQEQVFQLDGHYEDIIAIDSDL